MNINPAAIWDELCKLVIRPQRCQYEPSISLGPKIFQLGSKIYERTDFELTNPRGLKLKCSHYQPIEKQRKSERLPCVVYLHGNCGSRCDALDAVQVLLPYNITVLAFDFSGSGLSDGDYVSLGFYEKQDVATVTEYLWEKGRVSRIGLWGRSMGAATSIMYASIDHSIAGIVVDSPFTTLEDVMVELVESYQKWIPKMAVKLGIKAMRSTIQNKAGFDIRKLTPIECAKNAFVPALFAHAEGDNFIKIHHSEQIFAAYAGDKNFIRFEGDHNSERPDFFFDSVCIFFYNVLISSDPLLDTPDVPKGSVAKRLGVGIQTNMETKLVPRGQDPNDEDSDSDDDDDVSHIYPTTSSSTTGATSNNINNFIINSSSSSTSTNSSNSNNNNNINANPTNSYSDAPVLPLPSSPHRPQWNINPENFHEIPDVDGDDEQLITGLILSIKDMLVSCKDEEEKKKLEERISELETKLKK